MKKTFLFCFILILILSACTKKVTPSEFHLFRLNIIMKFKDPTYKIDHKYDSIVNLLRTVYYNDQLYRDIENPDYYPTNRKIQDKLDAENEIIIKYIIKNYGLLSKKEIGLMGEKGLILAIEHSSFSFKKTILKEFDNAFKKGKITGNNYAIFHDKMALEEKRFQWYGTQIIKTNKGYTFYPVDLKTVDFKRKSIGLTQPISFYIKQFFSVDFDSTDYVKQLPTLVQHFKIDTLKN